MERKRALPSCANGKAGDGEIADEQLEVNETELPVGLVVSGEHFGKLDG